MRRKPVIGITAQYDAQGRKIFLMETYERALIKAGALPVILPLSASRKDVKQLMLFCDGFLLPGGPDVNPLLFGEDAHIGCGNILPERDAMELDFVKECLGNRLHWKKPLLAVCRGIQVLNIAMGGTIYQDLDEWQQGKALRIAGGQPRAGSGTRIAHYQKASGAVATHTVLLKQEQIAALTGSSRKADSYLQELLGETEFDTNSFHHQILKKVAEGFAVCGVTRDGAVEAIHKQGHPFCLGVQWHPEELDGDGREGKIQQKLLECFVKACQKESESGGF